MTFPVDGVCIGGNALAGVDGIDANAGCLL
jgi:hypothetical protein